MKFSNLWIFILAALPTIVRAEIVVLTQTSRVASVNIPANVKVIDFSNRRADLSQDALDFLRDHANLQPSKYPGVCDTESGAVLCDTNDISNMVARISTAAYAAKISIAGANLEKTWPLLTAHPATNDIPQAGLTYRIDEGGGVISWWLVRQGDMISTQLSAHDAQGNAIISSVDLKTGTQTILSTASLPKTTKQAKQKGKP